MRNPAGTGRLAGVLLEEVRVLVVAGVASGAVVIGIGSRLAMLLLRLTSASSVRGVKSDDGFTIGRFTLAGTYNLLLIGAAAGVIGAGAYRLVARWLIGPSWFRRLTTGLSAGAVAGAMLVHSDGIDFTVLKPTWLAIGLFVALPVMFGVVVGIVVDAVRSPGSWTAQGKRRWLLPIAGIACFPLVIIVLAFAVIAIAALGLAGQLPAVRKLRTTAGYGLALRAGWLSIALAGLVALIGDIDSLV